MKHRFRWNQWNIEHVQKHGCTPAEAEMVVCNPARGYPRKIGDNRLKVIGRGQAGRWVHVVYAIDPPPLVFIIHAMPL